MDPESGEGTTGTGNMARGAAPEARNSPSSSVCYLNLDSHEIDTALAREEGQEGKEVEVSRLGQGSDPVDRVEFQRRENESASALTSSGADTPVSAAVSTSSEHRGSRDSSLDYFAPKPLRYQPTLLSAPPEEPRSLSVDHSHLEHKITQPVSPVPSEPVPPTVESLGRPAVQRNLSSRSDVSTASISTVRASEFLPQLPAHQQSHVTRAHRDYPCFPDQAYSALHSQHHPQPYVPRILRTRSSNPTSLFSYRHHHHHYHADMLPQKIEDPRSAPESGSKTAGNSPASSPGLFTPTTSPMRQEFNQPDLDGTYSSPYLHYTHRQIPKETHLAEVEVDPVSGRKIINHYEVIDELGRGVHGKVKLGRNLDTNEYVAIKIVERYSKRKRLGKSGNHEAKIKREIAILKKARHPNIVGLLEVIDDPSWKKVYIILEHVEMGEVKWRTEGAEEICLLEYRRYQREAHGVFEDESAQRQDDVILAEAHRKLDRAEKRKWRKLQQENVESGGAQYWSHEFGGEESYDDKLSRTSTATNHGPAQSQHEASTTAQNMEQEADPVYETCIHDDQRQDQAFIELQHAHIDEHSKDEFDMTGLEGTMYGAYDFDPPRGRTPSVIGSADSLSRLAEDEDQVPEHFRYVPLMTLSAARSAFRDTVLGLEFLHYQGVIHRDIKPANLLQAKDHHVKISDFGVSYLGRERPGDDDQSESEVPDVDEAVELAKTVGTPAFYAPELCRTDCDEHDVWPVSGQIDIWALGVTLYCLVFGRVPFHDNNTFVLMRRIADEEVYIPRQRLKAVDESATSRPSSHGRSFKQISSNKRLPHDLEYEVVDEDLYDLLKRLLTKDPRQRIKLAEVKVHPWLLRDIGDPIRWIDETDPSTQTDGRKIEVSKEDVEVAVVPINVVDRMLNIARKAGERIGGVFGVSRQSSRRRAKSSVPGDHSAPPSNASSSSTISQDVRRAQEHRRHSLKPEDILSALKAPREDSHPLAQSVTASPEASEQGQFFSKTSSRPHSPAQRSEISDNGREGRPLGPERVQSHASATGSVRTIRQSDVTQINTKGGASTLPALPSTPLVLDLPSTGSIGTIFKGATEKIVRSVRSRERRSKSKDGRNRAISVDSRSDDAHGEPSIGVSPAVAAGQVAVPPALREGPVSPANASPMSSRAPSVTSHDLLVRGERATPSDEGNLSRQSSLASVRSHGQHLSVPSTASSDRPMHTFLPLLGPSDSTEGQYSRANPVSGSTTDIRILKAQEELVRRRKLEEEPKREHQEHLAKGPLSLSHPRPRSAASLGACPPSPDDHIFLKKRQEAASQRMEHAKSPPLEQLPAVSPIPDDPNYTPGQDNFAGLGPSSSSECFASAMSQSTSNPSIPSVTSVDSSIAPEHEHDGTLFMAGRPKRAVLQQQIVHTTSEPAGNETNRYDRQRFGFDGAYEVDETSYAPIWNDSFEEGYQGDGDHGGEDAIESDSDSDRSILEMMSSKRRRQGLTRSESISNAELQHHRSKKRAESDENNDLSMSGSGTLPERSVTIGHGAGSNRSRPGSSTANRASIRSGRSGSSGTMRDRRRLSRT